MRRKLKYLITFTLINIENPRNIEYLFQIWTNVIDEGIENEEVNELSQTIINSAIKNVLDRTNLIVKEENIKFTGVYLLDTIILKS